MSTVINFQVERRLHIAREFVTLYADDPDKAAGYLALLKLPLDEIEFVYRPLIQEEFLARGWEFPQQDEDTYIND